MKIFKTLTAAVAATGMLSVALLAHAHESTEDQQAGHHRCLDDDSRGTRLKHDHGHHGDKGHRNAPFEEALNLTDAQKETLKASRIVQEPTRKASQEKLRMAREALSKAGDENADDVTLNKLANDLADIIAQQEITRIKMHRELLTILTPEQQAALKTFKAEHRGSSRWKDKQRDTSKVN